MYYYWAHVYHSKGKYEEAITYCQWARLLERRSLPQSNMAYARALDCLGAIYLEFGNRARALYFHARTSAIYHRSLPKNHYIFGFHFNHLVELYWQNRQYESALQLLTNTLTFIKKALPPDYPCEAQALHVTGLVHRSLNNRGQVIDYFKQSLQMRVSFQGNDHPYVARTFRQVEKTRILI
ncbi:unnamed protein product [Didymodactylos carnosus]|uniref:Tetratricopeptide repeat protein n=1 Tax=Didymodactylos carnosus TaxID=1234261 RepID=A0A814ELQ5_9BILA|nr:unnamed protein product [Didymodactylos carnosus]CAF3744230.1 unnamed protein product [Didymodactylos carnosus]